MRRGVPVRLRALLAASIVLVSGCAFGAGDQQDTRQPPERGTVRVGVGNAIDTAALRIAVSQGRFAEAGLRVELVEQAGQDEALRKLGTGELDIAFATDVTLFKAVAAGAPLRLQGEAYTAGRNTMALMTLPGSGYTDPGELRSPRIAVNTLDGLGTLTSTATLSTAGVDPARIRFTERPFERMVPALRSGEVHAAWMVEPYITMAQKEYGATVLADAARGTTLDFPLSAYASTAEFAGANPRTLALFREQLAAAQQVASDPAVVRRALPRLSDIDESTAWLVALGSYPVAPNDVRLQRVADLMHDFGVLSERLNVRALLPGQRGP